jgi:hypothetical protein
MIEWTGQAVPVHDFPEATGEPAEENQSGFVPENLTTFSHLSLVDDKLSQGSGRARWRPLHQDPEAAP